MTLEKNYNRLYFGLDKILPLIRFDIIKDKKKTFFDKSNVHNAERLSMTKSLAFSINVCISNIKQPSKAILFV